MTRTAAYRAAARRARRDGREYFVVWSREEEDAPGRHYHVASEWDLETFYQGCQVVDCVEP